MTGARAFRMAIRGPASPDLPAFQAAASDAMTPDVASASGLYPVSDSAERSGRQEEAATSSQRSSGGHGSSIFGIADTAAAIPNMALRSENGPLENPSLWVHDLRRGFQDPFRSPVHLESLVFRPASPNAATPDMARPSRSPPGRAFAERSQPVK